MIIIIIIIIMMMMMMMVMMMMMMMSFSVLLSQDALITVLWLLVFASTVRLRHGWLQRVP